MSFWLWLLLFWVPAQEHEFVTKLRSESIAERTEAERALKEMGPAARPHLEKAARDADRELAARAQHLLRVLELRELLSPRLLKAMPGIEEKLARDPGPAWTEALLAGAELRKGAREFPVLKAADLAPLAAAAVRGAATAEERRAVCDVVRKRELTGAIPELVRWLERDDAVFEALFALRDLGGAEAAPAVAALLRHGEADRRRWAAITLAEIAGRDAVPDLVPLLRDPEAAVRRAVLERLMLLGARDAAGDVRPLLRDDSPLVRESAAQAAGALDSGREAADAVAPLLADPHAGVRMAALWALAAFGARDRVREIVPLLKDPGRDRTDSVSEAAAGVLASLGATDHFRDLVAYLESVPSRSPDYVLQFFGKEHREAWIPALEEELSAADPRVVGAAAAILCRIRAREAIPRLVRLLEEGPVELRRRLSRAFWEFPAREAVPALLRRTEDADATVRQQALIALRYAGAGEVVPPALRLLKDPEGQVRIVALGSLFGREDVPVPEVLPLLKDPEDEIRQHALTLLAQRGARELIPECRAKLAGPDEWWRANAVRTLSALGAREAVPDLAKLLKDPIHSVRAAAAEALGRLGARDRLAEIRPLLADGTARVRMGALRALAALEDRDSAPAVRKILEGDEWLDARREAAEWLCRFGFPEGVPLVLDHGYDLWVLNALRMPEAWKRAEALRVAADGEGPLPEMVRKLEKESGLAIRLPEAGLPAAASFGNRRGDLTFREALARLLNPQVFPHGVILEADHARVVGPEEEYDFWAAWWAAQKR